MNFLRLFLMLCALLSLNACQTKPWQREETKHLRLHYRPGSTAAKDLEKVKTVYERTFLAALQFLPQDIPVRTLDVYLYDELTERAYADPEQRTVHIMYGPRYRLTSLHEFLVVLVAPLNPKIPPGISEGLYKSQSKLRQAMQRRLEGLSRQGEDGWPARPQLAKLVENRAGDDETRILAGAFVRFLLDELGEERFWDLYLQISEENWQRVLNQYLERDIESVERDFRKYIVTRTGQAPGVR